VIEAGEKDTMIHPALVVLAAGLGSRYGGLKQLDPVGPNDETIMDYSIFDAQRAGFGKVVFVIRKDMEEAFRRGVSSKFERRIHVEYAFQELGKLVPAVPVGRTKPWGTAHAILMAANLIHEPFAVINSDDFYGAASYRVLAEHLRSDANAFAMAGFVLRNTLSDFGAVSRGLCQLDENGYLTGLKELKEIEREGTKIRGIDEEGLEITLTGGEAVSMNMWGFTPQVFPMLQRYFREFLSVRGSDLNAECYIPSAVNEMIATKQAMVKVLRSGESWFGVTYREDHPRVVQHLSQMIEGGSYPRRLWA
jgi:UTP-glucose-1-phosphate uridylyltransferase